MRYHREIWGFIPKIAQVSVQFPINFMNVSFSFKQRLLFLILFLCYMYEQ